MKLVVRKTKWVEGRTDKCELKPPGKNYELVTVQFKYKKCRSQLDGSRRTYTRITTIWVKE